MSERTGKTIASIERAMDVLALFADTGRATLGVSEIAQELGLSKAVVHRILSSFRAKGFVVLDEMTRRYALGPKAMYLGLAYMDKLDIRRLARPVMERLSAATDETSTLSFRVGHARVYIDQVTPARDVKMVVQLGKEHPLHAGASSKAFLAFLDKAEIDAFLARGQLERLTPLTIAGKAALAKELKEVRLRGYASSMGERLEGAGSVAAPVFGHDGRPVAVISICGPVERFRSEADRCAAMLVTATSELSRHLGYHTGVRRTS